ncbi:MAG: serpin family protein [Desulfomonilaceae bacterium]
MKRKKWFLFMVAVVISSVLWSCISWATDAGSRQEAAANAINAFGLELYQKLKLKDSNLFFSPYSISVALSMVCAGARGQTRDQIAEVLHSKSDRECLAADFGSLNRDLADSILKGESELNLANGFWLQKGYDFKPEYLEFMGNTYGAHPSELDFKRDPESARDEINKWVAQQTRDKIKDLITEGAINTLTRFVLANAIYFKGKWDSEFEKKLTKDAPFASLDGKKTTIPMMNREGVFGYATGDGFQALAMAYKEGQLSMVVLLPAKGVSLKDFEKRLNPDTVSKWLHELKETKVDVYFPKFKKNTPVYPLDSILKAIGMTDAFSKEADFSGMNTTKGLHVSAVVHKAFVDVNEEGTEAAAATASIGRHSGSINPRKTVFRADRPFVFFIRHNPTNTILFLGRFAKP